VVKSKELIGAAEYLTLYAGFRINRCRYNRVPLNVLGLLFNTVKKLFFYQVSGSHRGFVEDSSLLKGVYPTAQCNAPDELTLQTPQR
jgi:hypothetical protein